MYSCGKKCVPHDSVVCRPFLTSNSMNDIIHVLHCCGRVLAHLSLQHCVTSFRFVRISLCIACLRFLCCRVTGVLVLLHDSISDMLYLSEWRPYTWLYDEEFHHHAWQSVWGVCADIQSSKTDMLICKTWSCVLLPNILAFFFLFYPMDIAPIVLWLVVSRYEHKTDNTTQW